MKRGDVVRVTSMGRAYLGEVEQVGQRVARVRFLTQVPAINGHRRRKTSLPVKLFLPHDKAGIAWTMKHSLEAQARR